MEHSDLSSFQFAGNVHTPSRQLDLDVGGGVGALGPSSPDAWSLALTPSLFGRGSTPLVGGGGGAGGGSGLLTGTFSRGEPNLFEMSFGGSSPGGAGLSVAASSSDEKGGFFLSAEPSSYAPWKRPSTPSGLPWFTNDDLTNSKRGFMSGTPDGAAAVDILEGLTPSWGRYLHDVTRRRALSTPGLHSPGGALYDNMRNEEVNKRRKLSMRFDSGPPSSSDLGANTTSGSSPTSTAEPPSLVRRGTTSTTRTLTGDSSTTDSCFSPSSQSFLETPPDSSVAIFSGLPSSISISKQQKQKVTDVSQTNVSDGGSGNGFWCSVESGTNDASRSKRRVSGTTSSTASSGKKNGKFTLSQPPSSFRDSTSRIKAEPSELSSLSSVIGGESIIYSSYTTLNHPEQSSPIAATNSLRLQNVTAKSIPSDPSKSADGSRGEFKPDPEQKTKSVHGLNGREKDGTGSSADPNSKGRTTMGKKPARKRGNKKESTAIATTVEAKAEAELEADRLQKEEEEEGMDEETKKRMFLERNRLAACKSRQKKKKRVFNLESVADDYAGRNLLLQATALDLKRELFVLRGLLADHDGCTCEHIVGYLNRERQGGGIPTIQALAGLTLELDYKNVPRMGSETDVYGALGDNSIYSNLAPCEGGRDVREDSVSSSITATASTK